MKRIKSAKVIQVIEVESVEGKGTDEEPLYIAKSYFSEDGKLLATNDNSQE